MKVALAFCMVFVLVATTPDAEQEYIFLQDDDGNYYYFENNTGPINASTRAKASDVTFYLYTRHNLLVPDVIPGAMFDKISSTHFDPKRTNAFISHGWKNNYKSGVNAFIRPAILKMHDANVFVVDWSGPSNKDYFTAKAAIPVIGKTIGNFINHIIRHYLVSDTKMHLIGHSFGAHIAGIAAKAVNGTVHSILGLDPSRQVPLARINDRLGVTDATYVHVIHTSGGRLGLSQAIGRADYYPNGGSYQPGCDVDTFGICAHGRAYMYAAESIQNSKSFIATKCDSKKKFQKGSCDGNAISRMGRFFVDGNARGSYYLTTKGKSPYSKT